MKTYSKGARRRAKKNSLGLPELAGGKTRQPDGRLRPTVDRQDPARLALEVRCRHAGLEVTRANLREVRAQWCGCAAGRAMASAVTDNDERARLWDAIQHMRRVQVSYDRAIGAPGRHAKCLRLLVPIEALSADAETPPLDERTDEEKLRDANRALMQLEGWLGYTDKTARSEAKRVIVDDSEARDIAGLLSALLCIADGLAGRRVMVWRGRA
ncbi:hypothetical protein IQ782_02820 [Salipiger pacificus]|uniref:Uncharacterized protein n=1 Tax=Salipiger mangrovisoli TaxID=2865933 RepID=A0ABR9WWU4_9RHOB|nr:hypothetical protein [Salipiger mangrovisoli]